MGVAVVVMMIVGMGVGAAVCVGVQMSVCVSLPLFAKTIGHISQTQTDQAVGCPVSANRSNMTASPRSQPTRLQPLQSQQSREHAPARTKR